MSLRRRCLVYTGHRGLAGPGVWSTQHWKQPANSSFYYANRLCKWSLHLGAPPCLLFYCTCEDKEMERGERSSRARAGKGVGGPGEDSGCDGGANSSCGTTSTPGTVRTARRGRPALPTMAAAAGAMAPVRRKKFLPPALRRVSAWKP